MAEFMVYFSFILCLDSTQLPEHHVSVNNSLSEVSSIKDSFDHSLSFLLLARLSCLLFLLLFFVKADCLEL